MFTITANFFHFLINTYKNKFLNQSPKIGKKTWTWEIEWNKELIRINQTSVALQKHALLRLKFTSSISTIAQVHRQQKLLIKTTLQRKIFQKKCCQMCHKYSSGMARNQEYWAHWHFWLNKPWQTKNDAMPSTLYLWGILTTPSTSTHWFCTNLTTGPGANGGGKSVPQGGYAKGHKASGLIRRTTF